MVARDILVARERLTVDEWAAMPDEAEFELVHGVLEEDEVPDYIHEVVVAWLIRVIGTWVSPRGGLVGGSDAKFALGPDHGRKPDVTVFLPGSPKPPKRGAVRVPPDIAIEVVSPKARDVRRDRIEKHDAYAAFGVRQYWIADPEAKTLEVWRLTEGGTYERIAGASAGRVEVAGLDGLVLDLDELWAETDRLGE